MNCADINDMKHHLGNLLILAWLAVLIITSGDGPVSATEIVHVDPDLIYRSDTGDWLVPLDFAAEVNRALARYEPQTRLIRIVGLKIDIQMQLNNTNFLVNGKQWTVLKTPPAELSVDDAQVCLVPLKEICTLMGGSLFERDGELFVKRPPEQPKRLLEDSLILKDAELMKRSMLTPVVPPDKGTVTRVQEQDDSGEPGSAEKKARRSLPRISVLLGGMSYRPDGGEVSQDRFEHNMARRFCLRKGMTRHIVLETGYTRWESSMTGDIREFVSGNTTQGTLRAVTQTYHLAVRYRNWIEKNLSLSIGPGVIRNKVRFDVVHASRTYRYEEIDNGIYCDVFLDYWFHPSSAFWIGGVLTRSMVRLEDYGNFTVSMDDITPAFGFTLAF